MSTQAAPAEATPTSVQTQTPPTTTEVVEEKVSKEVYERTANDLHSQKRKTKELEDKLKTMELESMKKNQDWQKIAELKEKEAREAEEERDKLRGSLVFDRKYHAVREAASKAGLKKEAVSDLDMLNLDDVQIETTSTGRVNVLGADDFVSKLKMTRPHWFGRTSTNINSDTPEVVSSGAVTYDEVEKARREWKKTGDSATYEKLLRKYKQQSRA